MSPRAKPIVRDAPPERGWFSLAQNTSDDALRTREAVGLPTDRPIVMTGHHAEWWHPGLVSKYIAAQHVASRCAAHWSWVLVNHKQTEPNAIEIPERDDGGILVRTRVDLSSPQGAHLSSPYTEKVHELSESWRACGETDALARWQHTMRSALQPHVRLPDPVLASAILRTPVVASMIERMRDDPAECALAYNRAVTRVPEAGLPQLHVGVDPGAIELPLWHVRGDGSSGRVFAGDMHAIDPARLAPRALLLTGLARLYLCDLFIHGVGGYVYDRATEPWFRDWLRVELTPMGAITADMTLALESPDVSEREVERLKQYAHRARHQPALLGDAEAQRRKLEAVRSIRGMPPGSSERRAAYATMHRELDAIRSRFAVELVAFERKALRAQQQREASALAQSRTWPFVLFDGADRDTLRDAVLEAITPA